MKTQKLLAPNDYSISQGTFPVQQYSLVKVQ